MLYCTDRFGREEFQDEVEDFGNVFGHRTAFVAHFCMATAVYFEVAWVRGYRWVFPNILARNGEDDVETRRGPSCLAQGVCEVHRSQCVGKMFAALVLLPGAHAVLEGRDDTLPVRWRRKVRQQVVMLYVMFRLKAILKSIDFQFHHYAVKNTTTWGEYARRHLTSDQVTADRKAHQKTQDELTHMKNWMQHRYEDEADLELEVLRRVCGDVDRLEVHCENRRRHPGNEEEYRRMRQKMEEEQNRGRGTQNAFKQALMRMNEQPATNVRSRNRASGRDTPGRGKSK